jgi:hypothetical protein
MEIYEFEEDIYWINVDILISRFLVVLSRCKEMA